MFGTFFESGKNKEILKLCKKSSEFIKRTIVFLRTRLWDDLLHVFGPNPYIFKYVVYYSYHVYIFICTFNYVYRFAR